MKLDGKEIKVGDKLFVIGKGYRVVGVLDRECHLQNADGSFNYFSETQNNYTPGYRILYLEKPEVVEKPVTVSQTIWVNFYEDGSVVDRANLHPIV